MSITVCTVKNLYYISIAYVWLYIQCTCRIQFHMIKDKASCQRSVNRDHLCLFVQDILLNVLTGQVHADKVTDKTIRTYYFSFLWYTCTCILILCKLYTLYMSSLITHVIVKEIQVTWGCSTPLIDNIYRRYTNLSMLMISGFSIKRFDIFKLSNDWGVFLYLS